MDKKKSRKLESYFDGELSERSARRVRKVLEGDSKRQDAIELRAEYEELCQLREAICDYAQSETLDEDGAQRSIDVWSAIEGDIQEISARRGSFAVVVSDWFRSHVPMGVSMRPALAVATCALLLFVIVENDTTEQPANIQLATPSKSSVAVNDVQPLQFASRKLPGHVSPLMVSDPVKVAYQRELRQRRIAAQNKQRLGSLVQIIDRDFVLGGLRADTVDIDWIRSNRGVRLYSARDRNAPPVIWVAKK